MNKTLRIGKAWLLATLIGVLAACGGGGGGSAGVGTLRVALTDNPACGYDEVVVTVREVRVHPNDAADNDPGWQSIPVNPPLTIDLLDYTNGALLDLGQTQVPAGNYTKLRLVLSPNTGALADRNWVMLSGSGMTVPLKTPSGQQSGLKINTSLDVRAGGLTDIVIDFDACKSVVVAGNSGQYLLKPVLRTLPRVETGVVGQVSVAAAAAGASVSLQQNGEVRRATVADPINGGFKLQPVEPGEYALVVVTPGMATAVVRNIQVFSGQLVRAAPAGERIDPPASTTAEFTGEVVITPVPTEIEASVAVRQTLTAGDTITLVDRPVDADTGGYTYTDIAVEAPRVAQHAAGASLSFAADNAAPDRFSVRATAGGASKTAGPLAPNAGDTVNQDFAFP